MIKLKARLLLPEVIDKTAMSGFPRLMQIMTGQVPTIHTFGIMSVDNPMKQALTPEQNNKRRVEFKEYMKHQALYGYVEHGGQYEVYEHAFFIPNINRKTLINFGKQYEQESVIFGTVDRENEKVVFELIYGDTVGSMREVVLSINDEQKDYYSICKGRKFQIPFFDEKYAPEKKLSRSESEFTDKEAEHLATLAANEEDIKADAFGKRGGMGMMLHRSRVLKALKALNNDRFPLTVFRAVLAKTPSDIKTEGIGAVWQENIEAVKANYRDSKDVWILQGDVDAGDIANDNRPEVTLKAGTQFFVTAMRRERDPRWSSVSFHATV